MLVAGAIHIDESFRVARLPAAGETVITTAHGRALGGKGANQAIAARRAGGVVALFGAVGDDADGAVALRELDAYGVDTALVQRLPQAETDRAIVLVDPDGENAIVVHAVAAEAIDPFTVDVALSGHPRAVVVLLQGEVPPSVNLEVAAFAVETGARLVVNLAPYFAPSGPFRAADPLVINEVEASQLLGAPIAAPSDVLAQADRLLAHCRSAIVTLGASGVVVVSPGAVSHIPAAAVEQVVDTTGAGDTFVGTIAARLAQGDSLEDAASEGVVAAGLTVSHFGAIAPSMARRPQGRSGGVAVERGVR